MPIETIGFSADFTTTNTNTAATTTAVTALSGKIPATLAVKAASTAAAVTDPALVVTMSPNSTPAKFRATGSMPANPSITAGGTAQQALAANSTRNFLLVQNTNTTGDLWFNVSGTAAIGTGIKLTPGNAYEYPSHFTPTGAVSIIGATTGQTYTVQEA